jgi:hypothetical protein
MDLWATFLDKIGVLGLENIDQIIVNSILAIILLGVGILLGKFLEKILKRAVERTSIEREIKPSFVNLFISVIKWSIYVIFVNLALTQFHIPALTDWLVSALVIIPALTGAIVLIWVGFAIASYLERAIEESRIHGWEVLSKVFFYFVLYLFLFFAIKMAFVGQDRDFVNTILLIFTVIVGAAVAWWNIKKR